MENVDFNNMPQAVQMLLDIARAQQRELAELKAKLDIISQGATEHLILGKFRDGEIIYANDTRLAGLLSKNAIQHWEKYGVPFHRTANGVRLYTTPSELDAYLNPHREAKKSNSQTREL